MLLFGNQAPLSLRVPPAAAIKKEFSNASRSQQWLSYYKKFKHLSISDQLYNCGAGITNFHIDPNGNLQPCLMTHHYQYNLLNGTFRDGWSKIISYVRKSNAVAAESCRNCEQRTLCGYCPAFFELEGGSEKVVSDYICEMGKLRFQFIRNNDILK